MLEGNLAPDEVWNNYFGFVETIKGDGTIEINPIVPRQQEKGVLAYAPACDEVWTLGHGRRWHEDTRETRHYQAVPRDEDGIDRVPDPPEALKPYLKAFRTMARGEGIDLELMMTSAGGTR